MTVIILQKSILDTLYFLKMNLPLISTSEPKNFSAVAEGGEGFLLPPPFLLLLGVDIVIISCSISFLSEFFHYDLIFFVSSKRLISIIFLSTVADVRIYNSRLESKKVVSLTQLYILLFLRYARMHVWTFDYRALTLMKVLQCYCTRQYFLIQFLVLQKEYYLYFTTTLIYNKCNLVCKNSLVKKSSAKETNNISQTFHVTFFKKECCKARIKTDTVWQKTLLKNDRIMLDEVTQKDT